MMKRFISAPTANMRYLLDHGITQPSTTTICAACLIQIALMRLAVIRNARLSPLAIDGYALLTKANKGGDSPQIRSTVNTAQHLLKNLGGTDVVKKSFSEGGHESSVSVKGAYMPVEIFARAKIQPHAP